MLLPKCTYNLHSRVPQILVQKSHFAYLTSMGGRQKCITISVRHMRHNAVWNSRICLNIVWLLMLTVLTSFSSLKKMWEAGINYYFGTCAVFPLFMWSEGMMLEEQHSLLWDLLIFKTWFETWKNTQSFLLKKKKKKNPTKTNPLFFIFKLAGHSFLSCPGVFICLMANRQAERSNAPSSVTLYKFSYSLQIQFPS